MHVVGEAVRRPPETQQQAPEVLGVDMVRDEVGRIRLGKGLQLRPRTLPDLVKGLGMREHGLRLGAEDEGNGVDPMRPDVADRPQGPTFRGQYPPVVIGLLEQPVLEEVSLHMDDAPDVPALDHGAHLEDGGEEPAHVVHREHRRRTLPQRGQHPLGLARVHAQRLLADDVLPRGQRRQRLLHVHLVGGRDVDDVDIGRSVHRPVIIVPVDLGNAPPLGGGSCRGRGTADRSDLHAETTQGLDVDGPDESGPDDAGPERVQWKVHGVRQVFRIRGCV